MKKIKIVLIVFVVCGLSLLGNVLPVSANGESNTSASTTQQSSAQSSSSECKGIKLNTDFPFVGNCIGFASETGKGATQINVFGKMIQGLMKLIITIIMVMSLLMIVFAGVLITMGGADKSNYSQGVTIINKVAVGMALLGASGVILKLINPNFFT